MSKRVCKNCEYSEKHCETWRKYQGEYTCQNPESHNFDTVMPANRGCNKFSKYIGDALCEVCMWRGSKNKLDSFKDPTGQRHWICPKCCQVGDNIGKIEFTTPGVS